MSAAGSIHHRGGVSKLTAACELDWWVKERQQWLGRVRRPDGRQEWIKAADLRPAKEG